MGRRLTLFPICFNKILWPILTISAFLPNTIHTILMQKFSQVEMNYISRGPHETIWAEVMSPGISENQLYYQQPQLMTIII